MKQVLRSSSGHGPHRHRSAGVVLVMVLAILHAGAVGVGYLAARRNSRPEHPVTASTSVVSTTKFAQPGRGGPVIVPTGASALPTPDPTMLAVGAGVYAGRCASCHGSRGEGQPSWWIARPDGSYPASPHDSSGHTWHHSDAELERIISLGGTTYLPKSTMPAFGQALQVAEIRAVIAYIKTFWGPRERAAQAEISREAPVLPLKPLPSPP